MILGLICDRYWVCVMKATVVREVREAELEALKGGLRSTDAFTLRRCQILLGSSEGQSPRQIAARLYCSAQCVRNAVRAFQADGLVCLKRKSPKRRTTHTDRLASLMGKREASRPHYREWMLSVSEVARLLRIHPNSVRRWADVGLITSYRVGTRGDRRFKFDDVDSFLNSRREG